MTIINAYVDLLQTEQEFPETVSMDRDRIIAMAAKTLRLGIVASTLFLASALPVIGSNAANRATVKKEVSILLQGVKNDK